MLSGQRYVHHFLDFKVKIIPKRPLPDSRRVSHSLVGGFILCETHDREEARAPEIKVDEREVEPELDG